MSELSAEVEVVLVNDGSSERTIGKIANWAAEDSRIKVIHLPGWTSVIGIGITGQYLG